MPFRANKSRVQRYKSFPKPANVYAFFSKKKFVSRSCFQYVVLKNFKFGFNNILQLARLTELSKR